MKISLFGKELFEVKSGKAEHYLQVGINHMKESKYLPDFKTMGMGGGWGNPISDYVVMETGNAGGMVAIPKGDIAKPEAEKKPDLVTPKGVYELKMLHDASFKLNTDPAYLEGQITDFKDKLSMIGSEEYDMRRGTEEIGSVVLRMENRKKYAEHAEFFEQYPYTTNTKVNELLKKESHLKLGQIAQFIADMPKDATAAMKMYDAECQKLCDKKAVFYIIADQKDFKKTDQRRDPILLAQSPFAHAWQILGAWDDEMLFLDDL